MSNPSQVVIDKKTLEMVVQQITLALSVAKDVPEDVRESGLAFCAALKNWGEKKAA